MKNLKRMIASVSAAALAAVAMFSAASVSAEMAEKELEYKGPSESAYILSDDGSSIRYNLVNEYAGSGVFDLERSGAFAEKISVTFTVSGLGDNNKNVNLDGSDGDAYEARLMGNVGTNTCWDDENPAVAIDGDGTYTADFVLNDPCDYINILFLETNINVYQYSDTGSLADSGVTFSVDKVTTMAESGVTNPDVPAGTIGTASLVGAIGDTQVWNDTDYPLTEGSKTADVDGDAQYEVIWNVTDGGTNTLQFLVVQIPGLSSDKYPDLAVKVDGVYIDGNEVADYTTSAEAITYTYTEGGPACTRIYLRDEWAGTGVADLPADTTITSSIKVVFTVSGTGVQGTSNVSSGYEKGDVTKDGTVNLYDAIEIARYMMGMINLDPEQLEIGDMTGDSVVNLYDAIEVCKIIMG